MKQTAVSLKTLNRISSNLLPLLVLAVVLPVLVLMAFGLVTLFKYGYIFHFTVLLTISAVAGTLCLWVMRRKTLAAQLSSTSECLVQASSDWSDFDRRIWDEANQQMDTLLAKDAEWQVMMEHAKEIALFVADRYHGNRNCKELSFSAPELLKMVEEVSRRYRLTLKRNVPYIEKVNLSSLKVIYDHRNKASWARRAWDSYRAYRIFNPYGLIAEARGLLLGKVFSGMSMELQSRLQKAFLQEVASVAIDLYSGRFRLDESEIQGAWHENDQQLMSAPARPVRVCLIGQVSSGKSAIINVLQEKMAAEVNMLPATDRVCVYECSIQGMEIVHLVDLPGLDGHPEREQVILQEVSQSDIVLWVLKANQSSRSLDLEFLEKLNAFYQESANRSRKRPVLIGVLNQVDRLKPHQEWQPPYDLEAPVSQKAKTIKEALDHNKNILSLDAWVAMAVAPERENFNVSELIALLEAHYEPALQVQLNRRRMQSDRGLNVYDNLLRTRNAVSKLFKNLSGQRDDS